MTLNPNNGIITAIFHIPKYSENVQQNQKLNLSQKIAFMEFHGDNKCILVKVSQLKN